MNEWADLLERITDEIELLNEEVDAVRPLADKLRVVDPDPVELRAVAATLPAFYSGIERIVLLLVRRRDTVLPSGIRWHRELLDQAAGGAGSKTAIISQELKATLVEYLGFRHVFRHNYPGTLRWAQCGTLFRSMPEVLRRFRIEVDTFFDRVADER